MFLSFPKLLKSSCSTLSSISVHHPRLKACRFFTNDPPELDFDDKALAQLLKPYLRRSPQALFGKKRIGSVELPLWLDNGVKEMIKEYDKDLIRVDASRIYDSLRSTTGLVPNIEKSPYKDPLYGPCQSAVRTFKKAAKESPLKPHLLTYGTRESMAYLVGYMPIAYGPIFNVLAELQRRIPDFKPKRVLDFGTGPGTAIWATQQVWQNDPEIFVGIDKSHSMLAIANSLLSMQPATDQSQKVVFRRFLEYNPAATKYDLVISAFSLNELSENARRTTLDSMWKLTRDILVLIERGTPAGFDTIAKARQTILQESNNQLVVVEQNNLSSSAYIVERDAAINEPKETTEELNGAHVVAPCPHDGICPLMASRNWCHFSQRIQRPSYLMRTKKSKFNLEDSMYSYVILRKGIRPEYNFSRHLGDPKSTLHSHEYFTIQELKDNAYHWSRLILPPIKRKGHIVMDVCHKKGFIERCVIPKSQGKIEYRDAKKSMWGDLFPHRPKNPGVQRLGVITSGDRDADEKAMLAMKKKGGANKVLGGKSQQQLLKSIENKDNDDHKLIPNQVNNMSLKKLKQIN
ncbi:1164_t:CDS:10 [Ambispora leptoticha]|uniref:1164_t:CDS:1 n=1 Tax=Ambispora leptoticha TaxID=144679 RepID=A0A9N9A479_9GLOM|nr:1164_t:CDS:10 [Ambispora leptoticha]